MGLSGVIVRRPIITMISPPYNRSMAMYRMTTVAAPICHWANLLTNLPSESTSTGAMIRPVAKHSKPHTCNDHVATDIAAGMYDCKLPSATTSDNPSKRVATKTTERTGARAMVERAASTAEKMRHLSIGIMPPFSSDAVSTRVIMKYTKKKGPTRFTTHWSAGDAGMVAEGPGDSKAMIEMMIPAAPPCIHSMQKYLSVMKM